MRLIMCELTYQEMVLEYVVSDAVFSSDITCPSCHKNATQTQWEQNDGGCINQYSAIRCSHCGHKEGDLDENEYDEYVEQEDSDYDIYLNAEKLDYYLESLKENQYPNPMDITEVKYALLLYRDDYQKYYGNAEAIYNSIISNRLSLH